MIDSENEVFYQGDIIWLDFNSSLGREERKYRPALVLSSDRFNKRSNGMYFVCPITSSPHSGFIDLVPYLNSNGDKKYIMCEQIKVLDLNARDAKLEERCPYGAFMDALIHVESNFSYFTDAQIEHMRRPELSKWHPGDVVRIDYDAGVGKEWKYRGTGVIVSDELFNQDGLCLVCPVHDKTQDNRRTDLIKIQSQGSKNGMIARPDRLVALDTSIRRAEKVDVCSNSTLLSIFTKVQEYLSAPDKHTYREINRIQNKKISSQNKKKNNKKAPPGAGSIYYNLNSAKAQRTANYQKKKSKSRTKSKFHGID